MKRYKGESFEDYRTRRKTANVCYKIERRGRYAGTGQYVDPRGHEIARNDLLRRERRRNFVRLVLAAVVVGLLIGVMR